MGERERIPVKSGQMKKEGEKWKGYRSRFFCVVSKLFAAIF